MKITKKVTFIAKDENVGQMKDLLKTMIEASKNEDGCLLYDIFQSKQDEKEFLVIESWRDEKALKNHQLSAHYNHYKSSFEPYCAHKSSAQYQDL